MSSFITTKKGSSQDAKISFNGYYGVTKVNNKIKPLNVAQYKELMDEIGMINLPDGLTDQTNWFDEVFRTARPKTTR